MRRQSPLAQRMTPCRRGAALLLGLALAGCSAVAPPYERPAAPVADRFSPEPARGGEGATQAATAAADLAWSSYFADPRLRRLIELALAGNRDLRLALSNVELARAQLQARRADDWPTLSVGAGGVRQPTGSGTFTTLYTAGLALSAYELDLFGRVRSLGDAAQAQFLASAQARQATQISLVAAVASADLVLRSDDEEQCVIGEALVSREESLKLIKLKFERGAASEIELRQAESLIESARVAQAQQTRQRLQSENALVLLLGQPMPRDLPAGLGAGGAAGMPELPAGLPAEVLTRRPDVRAAELLLVAAHANIAAARAAFFPKITLTASVGVASRELSGLFSGGAFAWSLAPQLLQPIFDAGRNEANLAAAQAVREAALAQYEKAIQSAFREVADALAGRATLTDQLHAQRAQTLAEEARLRLAELRQRNGASSALEVLDARRSVLAARQALVLAELAQAQNGVALYKALGGGALPDPSHGP